MVSPRPATYPLLVLSEFCNRDWVSLIRITTGKIRNRSCIFLCWLIFFQYYITSICAAVSAIALKGWIHNDTVRSKWEPQDSKPRQSDAIAACNINIINTSHIWILKLNALCAYSLQAFVDVYLILLYQQDNFGVSDEGYHRLNGTSDAR